MAAIGERIRTRRAALGLSLREVARTGLSPGYVSRVERGERQPSAKALRSLAPLLQCSAHWLETGNEDPAVLLARLVVRYQGKPLPRRATTLAREILGEE